MLELPALVLALVLDPLAVRWEAPAPGCASAAELEARLRARLGARADEGLVEVEGTVSERDDGLHLRLRIAADARVTERELVAPVCEELVDATVLIASLVVEERTAAAAMEPVPEPPLVEVPAPETPAPVEPTAAVEPETPLTYAEATSDAPASGETISAAAPRSRPSRRPIVREGSARLGVGAAGGQLPGVGASILAGASMGGRRWLARADLAYALPRRALVPGFDDRGALLQAWYVSLDGGLRWPLGERVRVPVTLGLDVGALHGRGFGVPTVSTRAQPWLAPALDAGLEARIAERVWLWLGGRASVPLLRPAFAIEGRGTVFRSDRLAWRAAGGVRVTFGGRSR